MTEITFAPGVRMPVLPHAGNHSKMLTVGQAFASRTMLEGDMRKHTTTELYVDKMLGPDDGFPEDGFPTLEDAMLGVAELTSGMETAMAVFEYDDRFFGGRLQWQLHDSIGMGLSSRQQIHMEDTDPAEFAGFFGGTKPEDNFQVFHRSFSDARPVPLRAIVDGETVLKFDLTDPPRFDHPELLARLGPKLPG